VKTCHRNFWNIEHSSWRSDNRKFWSSFPSSKVVWPPLKMMGHPLMSKTGEDVDQLKESVLENRWVTIHEVANMLHISFWSVQRILKKISTSIRLLINSCPAALHSASSLPEFLTKDKITVISHPPYSWDLALFDFFLFPKLKVLKGKIFLITMIRSKYHDTLADFQTMHFTNYFEQWHDCSACCIKFKGEYFEGKDNSD
jgi:hypothetical protein